MTSKRVLVVGSCGVGKSSMINLLAKKPIANTNDFAKGCTFDFDTYSTDYNGTTVEVIDTIGFNDSQAGLVPAKEAFTKLIEFVTGNTNAFNLIIFVMRKGRIDDNFQKNYKTFYEIFLNSAVPALLYVSHCEEDDPIDKWKSEEATEQVLNKYNFTSVICGTTKNGGRFEAVIKPLREDTRKELWNNIVQNYDRSSFHIKGDLFFLKKAWNLFCDIFKINYKFLSDQCKKLINHFQELGMEKQFIKYLEKTLRTADQ